jgi:Mg-chelatase subunit ChlI
MYPFSAIVGQEDAKLALAIGAVDPGIGGILLSGVKGTGKSTLVRAFAEVLPELPVRSDCRFHCLVREERFLCDACRQATLSGEQVPVRSIRSRIVTVPLGTTEDRLLGTVSLEALLQDGRERFQPGLLAEANNQILYVDEVNLLPDSITDDILDSAASGFNTVEREGISITHPARFTLVGTMNPEEGQLRPQILDRFALSVTIETITDPALRTEIISRSLASEADPKGFQEAFSRQDDRLRQNILEAKTRLDKVQVPLWVLRTVASAMASLQVDGQRPDIVTLRAAIAVAALDGRSSVDRETLLRAAPLAVCHRTRSGGFSQPPSPDEVRTALTEAEKGLDKGSRDAMWSVPAFLEDLRWKS